MAKKKKSKQQKLGVENAEITEEMEKAYIDYAMSVIVSRALPSVEDGLKPVHRRILYAMDELGLDPKKPTKKSARIVGDVLGKLHPHGDKAVYDSLVRMAQNFSLRYPLVDGQGNFGSMDGDPAAAMRYTEARLNKISLELLDDLDKETVEMTPNFDNSMEEPTILPAKLPNLLINGASGIAVGMATNIPPYNLTEVCDGIKEYIDNPDITIKELTKTIKGPDFPTGGKIAGKMEKVHKNGRGRVWIRGKMEVEDAKRRERIVVTEIPYQVNKSKLISEIAELVKEKKLPKVKDVRDESAKGNVRIVIDLKQGANPEFTKNRLYKKTKLQKRFDTNIIALVKGKPKRLSIKDIVREYVRHRKEVIKKRSEFELNKAEERIEVVNGLLKALKDIDNIIKTIKKSKNTKRARKNLIKKFSLSKRQANAILKMRLSSLTSLQQEKLKKEKKELEKKIKELKKILDSEKEILKIIKKDLKELKKKYGDERRSQVASSFEEIKKKDLVQKKDVAISITEKGYIKRQDFKYYREQKRGGRGVTGSKLATGDFVKEQITCSTHDYLLLFTNHGRVYWLKAYKVPEVKRKGKGKPIVNLLNLNKNEEIASILNVNEFKNSIIMATEKGQVKKLKLDDLGKPRKSGKRVMKLPKDDQLLEIKYLPKDREIMLMTARGQAIRFNSEDVRAMGRSAYGVIGIKLEDNDKVVGVEVPDKKDTLLSVTKEGYGKRSKVKNYRLTKRAGKGVINMNVIKDDKIRKKTGPVVATSLVKDEDSIIVSTAKGMTIRMPAKDIRVMGRNAMGVKVVNLKDKDRVTDVVKVPEADED